MTKINLDEITSNFGELYRKVADATKKKDAAQKEMFQAFTQLEARGFLAEQIVEYDKGEFETPEEYVATFYPGWVFVEQRKNKLLLREDPALKKSSFINTKDGYVYGRTYVVGGPSFDDDALREKDPDLWMSLSQWPEPWYGIMAGIAFTVCPHGEAEWIESIISEFLTQNGITRVLIDPSLWTEEQEAAAAPYWRPGKLSARLVAPRKATDEEMSDL